MDAQDKAALRARMEEELAACRQDVERLEVSARPVAPDRAIGRLTRMDSLNDQGISSAALQQNREKLYKLEQALQRIDRPAYGDCAHCGHPIPLERLMALPESTRCTACASA